MSSAPPVFLIGYRGTGKSTVARLLAAELGADAVDSDAQVEAETQRTIAEIFATDGEAAFRDHEQRICCQLAERDNIVAALGGGAILREATRKAISEQGIVAWLRAKPTTLAERLRGDTNTASQRPSLTGKDVITEIEEVLAERTPLYEQCADLIVETDNRSPAEVVTTLLELISPEST